MPPNSAQFIIPDIANDAIPVFFDPEVRKKLESIVNETEVLPSLTRNYSADALATLVAKREVVHEIEVTCANAVQPLKCAAQMYAWGRYGSDSMVAQMKEAHSTHSTARNEHGSDDFETDEATAYAELWVGTHPNGMSTIMNNAGSEPATLLDYAMSNPSLHCGDGKATDLTFLLKILSIRTCLSIQAHPDKKLAQQLHAERPKVYKDGNHKPEMAVALTDDVEAMCGFRPIEEIAENLRTYPELSALIGEESTDRVIRLVKSPATRDVLQQMFHSYLVAPDEEVQKQLNALLNRLKEKNASELDDTQKLILKLVDQFSGDPGIMAPLIFNHIKLKTGEAFYIAANEPHAYICGNILECMACSDNVVRAGLTPKLKDVPTLVSMLTYKSAIPEKANGRKLDACTTLYEPPVPDFAIELIDVPPGTRYVVNDVQSPSVLLTLNGDGIMKQGDIRSLLVSFGSATFMSANTKATIIASEKGVRIARAMSNVHHY